MILKNKNISDVHVNGPQSKSQDLIEEKKNKAICILGMHRSGTSAIARVINLLGVFLGESDDMMASSPENPEGFWERNDLNLIHERMLDQLKKRWDTAMPPQNQWYTSASFRHIWKDLRELIKVKFSEHKLWGWKDPRTSLLLDVWKDLLKELGIDLACLYVVRNPIDVAKSLERRDGFPYDKSFGIWFNYNIAALNASASLLRVFVSYERLLSNWKSELKKCAQGLSIPWPKDDTELSKNINEFIRPELSHSNSKIDDLEKSDVPDPVIKLYKLLEGASDEPGKQGALFDDSIKKMSSDFFSYARFFQHDIKQLWDCRQKEIKLNKKLTERERQLTEKDENAKMMIRYDDRIKKIDEAIKRIEVIGQKEDEIKKRDERIKELEEDIKKRKAFITEKIKFIFRKNWSKKR